VERQDQVLEDAGGAKGIQQLREEAAAADKDATVAKETADSLAADKVCAGRGGGGINRGGAFCVRDVGVFFCCWH